ncbi:MAG: hypothetical protein IJW67_11640 [Blautia sp.]|nr:hypothetical protein [Blautia sp.]
MRMETVSLAEFELNPARYVYKAFQEEYSKIVDPSGLTAILIDEIQYIVLKQALKICTEHPEWTDDRP